MLNSRFEYKKEEKDGVIIFILVGSLDIGTVSTMKADIDSIVSGGKLQVLFDLYDLEQIDSAIIQIFQRQKKRRENIL